MDRYIKLISQDALGKPVIRDWFNTIVNQAPSGVVISVDTKDDDEVRHIARLVHQTTATGSHAYLVPISRDLGDEEVEQIVDEFASKHPELDFDVETQVIRLRAKDPQTIALDAATHLNLCNALAKQRHERWMRERADGGWRYGVEFDPDERVHPLLRPWDQLPERYKMPDLDWPQMMINLLNDNGYLVVPKEEFDRLVK